MSPELAAQIDAAPLSPGRPLIVVDADEVLVHFAPHLARWLAAQGWRLALREYRLDGAIRHAGTGEPAGAERIRALLDRFFAEETHRQEAIAGAAAGLAALAPRAQIVVLTNVPAHARAARMRNLAGHGMAFPVIANTGGKGRALAELARRAAAPVAFIDDSPVQIVSARRHAPGVVRIHFTGSEYLRPVMPQVAEADHTAPDWPSLVALLERGWG
ncbi:MAG: hypothetical protein KatS3mg118_1604 [Paracoccaceae bacterium]|nr:MAG: hypothetical protein KatS3mg118_1604 [Paracoccaceae bacterium]